MLRIKSAKCKDCPYVVHYEEQLERVRKHHAENKQYMKKYNHDYYMKHRKLTPRNSNTNQRDTTILK